MNKLNESQKQILRTLVKLVRDESIPQEFRIQWNLPGGPVISNGKNQMTKVPSLSPLTIDILQSEGLLFSSPFQETRSTAGHISKRQLTFESSRTCLITPAGFQAVDSNFAPIMDLTMRRPPVEITESLARFRSDFPDSTKPAFIMMQFGTSQAHQKIHSAIHSSLEGHGMVALRADDKQYHDDMYSNIMTYIHGARFGIAVFERIEAEAFNPNVSLEVGYMLGLGKSVCFLKDQTLKTLQTDLVGKLYREFDPQNPVKSIPPKLFAWMDEKGFIVRHRASGTTDKHDSATEPLFPTDPHS